MKHLLFKQAWVRSLTSNNAGIQNCWKKHTAEKMPTALAGLEKEGIQKLEWLGVTFSYYVTFVGKLADLLSLFQWTTTRKKRGFTDFPGAILLTGRDKYEVLPFLWPVSWPRNKTKFQLYLYIGNGFVCGDRPHWLSILDLFGLSESEATISQTNRKRKM